jgi:subtilisin family serine protease
MPYLKQLLCLAISVLVFGAPFSAIDSDCGAKDEQPDVVDYYLADGQQVKFTTFRDRIGLILKDDVKIEALQKFVDDPQWKIDETFTGGIKVLRTTLSREPNELENLVRTLMERNVNLKDEGPLKRAGLLGLADGAKNPVLLTDEFLVEFNDDVTAEFINELNDRYKVEVVRKSPFHRNQFVLRSTAESKLGFLEAPIRYFQTGRVQLAHPNFVRHKVPRSTIPNDPLFCEQWHHENTGQGGGTPDADVDTPLAWDITIGSANRVIAVIDFGFEVTHPDLVENIWTNPGEIPGDGIDNDGNSCIDDIHGWNFYDGNNSLTGGLHGTSVAGCVGARGNNCLGVCGSCLRCSLLLIKTGEYSSDSEDAACFDYARVMGAEIITNSWGYDGSPVPPVVVQAIDGAARNGRNGRGCIVFFAMPDDNVDACGGPVPDVSALERVIAVSSVSNVDRFDDTGFGNCMDVLGPTTNAVIIATGTLGITTTAVPGIYTENFAGTSAATPVIAGIAGLVLDVAPCLTRMQVQRLIQDTADKVEDCRGFYSAVTGFSSPPSGVATHGYGRVNAFEAVRLAAGATCSGRGGVDVMLRDNRLDWGNTEQPSSTLFGPVRGFIPYWESVDIKVDAPPFQTAPNSSQEFDAFSDEDPLATATNRVYVRVRNRGPYCANLVNVKLHWAFAGTALPALPADFWSVFPSDSADATHWHSLGRQIINDLDYCGASVAGRGVTDASKIVSFDFTAPALDPTQPDFHHYCLFCVADSPQDPVSATTRSSLVPDYITSRDNNVTLRNLVLQPATSDGRTRVHFYIRNPFNHPLDTRIEVSAPDDWKTRLDQGEIGEAVALKPGEQRLCVLNVAAPDPQSAAAIVIKQFNLDKKLPSLIGGLTVRVGRKAAE